MMMMMRAKIFVQVKMSWTLVAHFTLVQLMNVSSAAHIQKNCTEKNHSASTFFKNNNFVDNFVSLDTTHNHFTNCRVNWLVTCKASVTETHAENSYYTVTPCTTMVHDN